MFVSLYHTEKSRLLQSETLKCITNIYIALFRTVLIHKKTSVDNKTHDIEVKQSRNHARASFTR